MEWFRLRLHIQLSDMFGKPSIGGWEAQYFVDAMGFGGSSSGKDGDLRLMASMVSMVNRDFLSIKT